MSTTESRNIRLGLFVLTGIALLTIALYLIGSKQNLFNSTFRISARFHNVNGLMKGNNVRFGGINVGTVESVEIVNDTSIKVVLLIETKSAGFIRNNAIASIGTDGLMGNKLVNINSAKIPGKTIEEYDELTTLKSIEMDEMIRTLDVTNENIMAITNNLRNITDKINSKNTLWKLLLDSVIAENVKSSIVNIRLMSSQGLLITGNLSSITYGLKHGKGSLGSLITDTILSNNISQTVVGLKKLSDSVALVTGNIDFLLKQLKNGKGSAGILLNDTMFVHNLNKSIQSIDRGAGSFNDNMEALKHTWPFKKYFKKQAGVKK